MNESFSWNGSTDYLVSKLTEISKWGLSVPQPTVFPGMRAFQLFYEHDESNFGVAEVIHDTNRGEVHLGDKVTASDSIINDLAINDEMKEQSELYAFSFIKNAKSLLT